MAVAAGNPVAHAMSSGSSLVSVAAGASCRFASPIVVAARVCFKQADRCPAGNVLKV
jgi:hypothetical protein